MNLVYGADANIAAWVAAHIPGCERGFGKSKAIGVAKGELIAGVVYHNWCPEFGTIEMSGASVNKRWLTRPVIHGLLEYPFSFCQMVVVQTDPDNPARGIWLRLGADQYEIPRLRGVDRPGIILTLTREQWMAGKYCMKGDADGQAKIS